MYPAIIGVIIEAICFKYDYEGRQLNFWNHLRLFEPIFFVLQGVKLFFFNIPPYIPLSLAALAEGLITGLAMLFMFKRLFQSLKMAYRLCCFKGKEIAYNPFHKDGNKFILYEMMLECFYGFYFYLLLGFALLMARLDFSEPLIHVLFGVGYGLFAYNFCFMWATTVRPRYVNS